MDTHDFQKAQKARILSCYGETPESLLEKGGEGSKGGKIIGHTKSGKPIYAGNHNSFTGGRAAKADYEHVIEKENYTSEDHKEAAEIHQKLFEKKQKKGGETSGIRHEDFANYHKSQAEENK